MGQRLSLIAFGARALLAEIGSAATGAVIIVAGIICISAVVVVALLMKRSLAAEVGPFKINLPEIAAQVQEVATQLNDRKDKPTVSQDVAEAVSGLRELDRKLDVMRTAFLDMHGQNVDRIESLAHQVESLAEAQVADRKLIDKALDLAQQRGTPSGGE